MTHVCCSVLQCVAVCRSVLQCGAVWCSVLQCNMNQACHTTELDPRIQLWIQCVLHGVVILLQCAAVCCSVLQCVAVCCSALQCAAWCRSFVAVCCSVLHGAVVLLQCVAVCCSAYLNASCHTTEPDPHRHKSRR